MDDLCDVLFVFATVFNHIGSYSMSIWMIHRIVLAFSVVVSTVLGDQVLSSSVTDSVRALMVVVDITVLFYG